MHNKSLPAYLFSCILSVLCGYANNTFLCVTCVFAVYMLIISISDVILISGNY